MTPPGTPRRKPPATVRAAAAFALVALAVGGPVAMHLIADSRLRAGLDAWERDRRADGWAVSHAPPQSVGWTPGARLLLADAHLAGAAETLPGGVDWQAGSLLLAWSPLHPASLAIEAGGRQTLRLGPAPTLHVAGGPLTAAVALRQPDATVPIDADGLSLSLSGAALTVAHASLQLTPHPQATGNAALLSVSLQADGIVAPAAPTLPVALTAAGALQGPWPPPGTPQGRARLWQSGGGSVVIPSLTARSGPLALAASGTGGLDNELQPVGRASLRLTGASALVDQLAAAGALRRGQAVALGAVLGLLERSPPDGGPPVVELPLNWEAGAVTVGGFTLAHTPDLQWPNQPP